MSSENNCKTIVIGGGQSGLSAGYFLARRGEDFLILDENLRAGQAWRERWDSMRLFTPIHMNHLPGMKFPGDDQYFPTKDETADYMAAYAYQHELPVRYGTKVESLRHNGKGYHITAGEADFTSENVIIATGAFHVPFTPQFARELGDGLFQIHSADYHNPGDIPVQNVIVVGAGNSGAEIALDLARSGKSVCLAGRDVGIIEIFRFRNILGGRPMKWFARNILTNKTPLGRKLKQKAYNHGTPLGRVRREEVAAAGVKLAPRAESARDGSLNFEDGSTRRAEGIVWATGYRRDYSWIKLPIFEGNGFPRHVSGVVPESPGLFFLGLPFQTGLTSSLLVGIGADAANIVQKVNR